MRTTLGLPARDPRLQPTRTRKATERSRNGVLLGSTALDVFMKEVNRLGPLVAVPFPTHWECRTVLGWGRGLAKVLVKMSGPAPFP